MFSEEPAGGVVDALAFALAVAQDVLVRHAGQSVFDLRLAPGQAKQPACSLRGGVTVTATEPDGAMLAELRKHVPANVKTVQAAFEDVRPAETYGLAYAAAALHWTNPEGRCWRIAALLEPGGVFASFGGSVSCLTRLWMKPLARPGHRSWRPTRFRRPQMRRLRDITCNGRVRSSNGPSGSPTLSRP
jgi:trans-aconitate methyltransferase